LNNHERIIEKITNKNSIVGVIGLGYVGLPLAIRFVQEGFGVIGFDIDKDKVESLNNDISYIKHISDDILSQINKNGFKSTTDFEIIKNIDVIVICVPTPLGVHNEPDLSYIHNTLDLISPNLKNEQILVLESTTYPGTTEDEIVPRLEKIGFKIGDNFFVGYSPEREDPGNKEFTTKNIPKVVSGHTPICLDLTNKVYEQIVDKTVPVSSPKVAEMTKILENIHRAVNIGLVNELKMVADKMNIDIYEVISAASSKPFGFTPYYPGPGLGGHCIPIDPFYLTWKAKEIGMNTRFIELAGEINTSMPAYVVDKTAEALNSLGQSIKNSKILVLGLSYKKNIDDLRESPSLEIMHSLTNKGAIVNYSDPFFKKIPLTRKYQFDMSSIDITSSNIKNYDIVILTTDHDSFDYNLIKSSSKLIIDTRGKFAGKNDKIIKA
tara:strand:- start:1244 stop:2554 length:1311 start_codon:yes stop_codon:yes gene_type:complete